MKTPLTGSGSPSSLLHHIAQRPQPLVPCTNLITVMTVEAAGPPMLSQHATFMESVTATSRHSTSQSGSCAQVANLAGSKMIITTRTAPADEAPDASHVHFCLTGADCDWSQHSGSPVWNLIHRPQVCPTFTLHRAASPTDLVCAQALHAGSVCCQQFVAVQPARGPSSADSAHCQYFGKHPEGSALPCTTP